VTPPKVRPREGKKKDNNPKLLDEGRFSKGLNLVVVGVEDKKKKKK